jgi:acyl-homoserine lactone acylase PvdQ
VFFDLLALPATGLDSGVEHRRAPPAVGADHCQKAVAPSDFNGVVSNAVFEALGVPMTAGSHGWIVSAAKSTSRSAMLFGGPQVLFNTLELFHEVQLKGSNGFAVMGRLWSSIRLQVKTK